MNTERDSRGEVGSDAPDDGRLPTGDLTEAHYGTSVWSDALLEDAGITIEDVPIVSVGGGLGSFALVDLLRISGVPESSIRVLTDLERPYDTYEYLATNSQIPGDARLRSDSGSVLDNPWGWPGYGVREAWQKKSLARLWQVATEPTFSEFFTPEAQQVFASVDRETDRIGWQNMVRRGRARTIRRREGGGYFVLHTPDDAGRTGSTKRHAYRCQAVHIAVGYPGIAMLPDLQQYRTDYDDSTRVVNAYERHLHIYEALRRNPSTVVVRGSGIVGSRVLQRLIDDRDHHGAQTTIVHLFRNYVDSPQGDDRRFTRPGGDGFAYQAFNYPKAAWGGTIREQLAALEGDARAKFLDQLGGTNTAYRPQWQEQLARGKADGFYLQERGTVSSVKPAPDGNGVMTTIDSPDGVSKEINAQYVIDATGLLADIRRHRLLADVLDHCGGGTNPKGRLDVEPTFEVRGTRSGLARLYASGSITLGGYYAGVDSFLGLQYAALQIADQMASDGLVPRLGVQRSVRQWVRWARNRQP